VDDKPIPRHAMATFWRSPLEGKFPKVSGRYVVEVEVNGVTLLATRAWDAEKREWKNTDVGEVVAAWLDGLQSLVEIHATYGGGWRKTR
jgi:hypothetical protein